MIEFIDPFKKSVKLCRFFDDDREEGKYGSFHFLADRYKNIKTHECGDKKIEVTKRFKKPLIVSDEIEALKKFFPASKVYRLVDNSMLRFDTSYNKEYINSYQYLDHILANEAKKKGYDAIIYKERESWGAMETEIQDLTNYNIKKLKYPLEKMW